MQETKDIIMATANLTMFVSCRPDGFGDKTVSL